MLAHALADEGPVLFGIRPAAPTAEEIHRPGGFGLIDELENYDALGVGGSSIAALNETALACVALAAELMAED